MDRLPTRRSDLMSRGLGAETVVVDGAGNAAHALSPVAASVFALCDGKTTVAAAASTLALAVADVESAVTTLSSLGLVTGAGMTRRTAIQRASLIGGGALVATVMAPLAAAHASGVSIVTDPNTVSGSFYKQADNSNTTDQNPSFTEPADKNTADGTFTATLEAPFGPGAPFSYTLTFGGLTPGALYHYDYRYVRELGTVTALGDGTATVTGDSSTVSGANYDARGLQFDIYLDGSFNGDNISGFSISDLVMFGA